MCKYKHTDLTKDGWAQITENDKSKRFSVTPFCACHWARCLENIQPQQRRIPLSNLAAEEATIYVREVEYGHFGAYCGYTTRGDAGT